MKRTYIFSLITILILALGFVIYFFAYVKGQEESLNTRGFRILSKLGDNITVLSNTRIKNVKNNLRSKDVPEYDSIKGKIKGENYTVKLNIEGITNPFIDTIFNNISVFERALCSGQNFIKVQDTVRSDKIDEILKYNFEIDLPELMNVLLNDALFEEYIILDSTQLLFKTIPSGFHYSKYDSLLDSSIGMEVSSIREIEINGMSYKLFLQPFQLDPENNWILGGLIKAEKYNTLRMAIPPTVITFLFLAALLTILSLPLLKLLFMGSTEQLYLSDAMFAGLSIILGSSIVVMLLFNIYGRMNDSDDRERELRSLGQLISERFRTEIKEAYDQLDEFDGLYEDGNDLVKISKDGTTALVEISDDSTTALVESSSQISKYAAKKYPLFNHLYWIDNTGKQRVKWTTKDKNSPKIDVKKREYFKTVYYNNEWNLYNDSDSIQFGFESIYSWNSGKALVGVSKKSHSIIQNELPSKIDTMPVIALATAFYSVIDPILPEGYGFAIIDESADVLFHSDKNKNLQENFMTESEENSKLLSVMYARRDECFKIKYSGEQHGIYISPVADLPLFVIAFKKLTKERSVHAQIMNFTFILIVGYFLSFAFMAFITRILKKSGSKLKKTSYIFGWIMPKKYREQIYFNTFFMHVLTIILMVLFLIISEHEVHKILILISGSIYSFLYTFLGLNGFAGKRFFSKENVPYLITTALIFIVLSTISTDLGYGWLILFQVILFLFYHINFGKLINVENWECRKIYVLMLVSYLGITSIIPVIFFYKISYEQEHEFAVKHDQLAMARIISSRKEMLSDSTRINFFIPKKDSISYLNRRKDIYPVQFENIYLKDKESERCAPKSTDEESIYNKIIPNLRTRYSDFVIESSDLTYEAATDSLWCWKDSSGDSIQLRYKTHLFNDPLIIKSVLPQFQFPGIIFLLILILMIIAFYHIIKFVVSRIFFDIKEDRFTIREERKLFERRPPDNRILLIGITDPEKRTCVESIFKEKGTFIDLEQIEKPFYLLSKLEQIKSGKNKLIIIDHFEYKIEDKELSHKKLDIINDLLIDQENKIVVTTSMELSHFEEVLKDKSDYSNTEIEQVMNRLMRVFSSFYLVYCPLQCESSTDKQNKNNKNLKMTLMESLWENEFDHGAYLEQLKPKLKSITDSIKTKHENELYDQTIHNIQHLAEPYYTSLWANCTKKEKYVLYDLADDGLVNPRNTKTITKLLNKGLIIYSDKLRIMNESFRSFVLTGLNPEEALQLEKEAKAGGIWNKFRNPILIMLVAIAVFLSITQKESLHNLISFLAPILALIPIMVRVFGSLSSSKIPTSKVAQD